MKFEGTRVWGFLNAAIGMRLPMSKDYEDAVTKSDTFQDIPYESATDRYVGDKDLALMQKLLKEDKLGGGQPNSKFMRMIHVQVAITAMQTFWSEFDTYKISTVSNSTSKMHKLQSYPIDATCFEQNPIVEECDVFFATLIKLEGLRKEYLKSGDKKDWYILLNNIPMSWLQTRMIDLNYATIRNMIIWRKNHKLNNWSGLDNPNMANFIAWAKSLPYANELLFN